MKTPSPKEIGTRWFQEVWNQRNTAIIPELMTPDAIGHLEGGQDIVGPGQFLLFQESIFAALPDIHIEVLNALSDGDDACILWSAKAVHSGHGMGLSPTGKSVSFRGITWFHIINGRITEGWDCWNQGGLMSALVSPV